ncbi:MAG: TIR domain-containing protein [Candidatus Poribacteria bacterium]|nr:TIR domain-containing protein [Candidatus Poribacteria bacterium]
MAKVKVFLSFEFDKDNELHHNFYAQASRGDSFHKIEDYSLKEAYQPHNDRIWLKKAKHLISCSDIVIVLTGQDAHNAPGVEKEVTIANQQDKPIFQIRPQNRTSGPVRGAGEVVPWKWRKIDAKISECLEK